MTREILMDSLCGERRLALIEDGRLCEMYMERAGSESLSGNIYVGRVENVLSGMNAAFVNIGLDKNAFLYAGDIRIDTRGDHEFSEKLKSMNIRDMVRPGQQVMVQVIKEPGGSKGPRVSCSITLAGRTLVLLPTIRYIGVSRKITDNADRAALRDMGMTLMGEGGCGMILRTAARDSAPEDIADEYRALCLMWHNLDKRGKTVQAPALIMNGGSLPARAVRDMLDSSTHILTGDGELYCELRSAAELYAPSALEAIGLYSGSIPLFDFKGVESEFQKALSRKVWLKSGGYLIIDYTEALTVVDVNTGKFVGKGDLEETLLKTNMEAATEIARQLRLRDVGGIVIVDFIDMESPEHRQALIDLLEAELAKDRTHAQIAGMTNLGLVEITRKKARQSVEKQIMRECPLCHGNGRVDTMDTVARRAAADLRRRHMQNPERGYLVHMPPESIGAMTAVGVPRGVHAHVTEDTSVPVGGYEIESVPLEKLEADMKLLREN